MHTEEFSVVRSLSTNKPIAVEYRAGISGSFDFNPTVRLY
jgi:hypothetical protein